MPLSSERLPAKNGPCLLARAEEIRLATTQVLGGPRQLEGLLGPFGRIHRFFSEMGLFAWWCALLHAEA